MFKSLKLESQQGHQPQWLSRNLNRGLFHRGRPQETGLHWQYLSDSHPIQLQPRGPWTVGKAKWFG